MVRVEGHRQARPVSSGRPGSRKYVELRQAEAENQNSNGRRKSSHILQKYRESCHHNFWSMDHETEKEKGKHPLQDVSMICKLIGSVNHLCIFIAVMKYLDDLPVKTLIEAQESNTAQSKLTPHVRDICAVLEATDPFAEAEGKRLARTTRKRELGTSSHDRTID